MLLARDSDACPDSKVPSVVPLWSTKHTSRFDATDSGSAATAAAAAPAAAAPAAAAADDDDDNYNVTICSLRVYGNRNYALFSQLSVYVGT